MIQNGKIIVKIELEDENYVDINFNRNDNLEDVVKIFLDENNLSKDLKENLVDHLKDYLIELDKKKNRTNTYTTYKNYASNESIDKSKSKNSLKNCKNSLKNHNFFENNKRISKDKDKSPEPKLKPSNNYSFRNLNNSRRNSSSVHDKLFKESQNKTYEKLNRSNIENDINYSLNRSNKSRSSSYLNNRFYYRPVQHKKNKFIKHQEIQVLKYNDEIKDLTFHPKINQKSENIQKHRNFNIPIYNKLINYGEVKNKNKLKNINK